MTAVEGMYGGLNGLAELLQVERVGPMHQAGSDSMLTSQTFFTLLEKHLGGVLDESRYALLLLPLCVRVTILLLLGFAVSYLVLETIIQSIVSRPSRHPKQERFQALTPLVNCTCRPREKASRERSRPHSPAE